MAAHATIPPPGSEPFVRGDPATFVVRVRVGGVDQDISAWTWRSFVRDRLDGKFISECETFDVAKPDDLPDLFPADPGAVPCVLLIHWTMEQTATWKDGFVADVEQVSPAKRTWLIFDAVRMDRDVSYDEFMP